MENLEYQTSMNSITGKTDLQPSVHGTDGVAKVENGFCWTQTLDEVEIVVSIPVDGDKLSKNSVKVHFYSQKVVIIYEAVEKLSVDFFARIDPDGSTWTVDDTSVVVTCEKGSRMMWPRLTM